MSVVPYKEKNSSKSEQVAEMFDNISPKYDFLNRLLSGGIDVYWRKKALKMIKNEPNKLILDIATGTGDLAIEAIKQLNPDKIVGVDLSDGMLNVGRQKIKRLNLQDKISMEMGDSEKLLFDDNTFDTVIVSFGVRNYQNLLAGLTEMYRVTKPGGTCLIVEFSKPTMFPFKQFYWFYTTKILPFIGNLVSKDNSAYSYLPESMLAFPAGKDFLEIFDKSGYKNTSATALSFGICSVYIGKK